MINLVSGSVVLELFVTELKLFCIFMLQVKYFEYPELSSLGVTPPTLINFGNDPSLAITSI